MIGGYYAKKSAGYGQTGVQNYMEKKLTDLHYASVDSVKTYKSKMFGFFLGVALVVLIPYIHIGVIYLLIWVPDKPEIDRSSCTCNCFDTVFRGGYENPGQTPYKHIYFNSTATTLKIWILTVLFVLMGYESVKYLLSLSQRKCIRWSMFFLYFVNLYPHYYSWWSYFSYYNEGFFNYFYHHMYFTITEISATLMVLNLCDIRNEILTWKILFIITINLIHVLVAGVDQFLFHVIMGFGQNFQSARDIGLMIPDLLHIFLPLYVLVNVAKKKQIKLSQLCTREEIGIVVFFATAGVIAGILI